MKIVIDRRIPGLEKELMTLGHEVVALEGDTIDSRSLESAEALFVRTRTRCDASLLEGTKVKLVGSATIGTDHIDTAWCRRNGIHVVNAPGCNAPAVMQYVAASLKAAGFNPKAHTLGVIGKGSIGSLVTNLYRRAGTRVLVSDPPRREAGFKDEEYLSLEEVLEGSDAVTLHVPYLPSTHFLLSHRLLENFKRPEIIVNASRGQVLEPNVLCLPRKFVVDTWPFEDQPSLWSPPSRRLLIQKAFIATPHIAGYSIEGKTRATNAMLSALRGSFPLSSLTSGLSYNLRDVLDSFNPMSVSYALKSNPEEFERLRGAHLRAEPKPINEEI